MSDHADTTAPEPAEPAELLDPDGPVDPSGLDEPALNPADPHEAAAAADAAEREVDDDLLEAAAVGEEDPAAVHAALPADEEAFVDGTPGRSDLAAERDEYKDAFLRVKADFENYKKRADKNVADRVERATGQLVAQLLPVLDACDAAIDHGAGEVEPIHKSLLDILEREGLERLDPVGDVFDPAMHEAVMHEEGEPGAEPTVTALLRIGYAWKGKVLRPPMVKVKG